MSERHPKLYLSDVLESGHAIQTYVQDVTFEQFITDRMRNAAVVREFEIIGEAVGKISESIKANFPKVPWREIKDFRNLLVHEYFGIDQEIIWNTIKQDLPLLLDAAEKILSTLPPEEILDDDVR